MTLDIVVKGSNHLVTQDFNRRKSKKSDTSRAASTFCYLSYDT